MDARRTMMLNCVGMRHRVTLTTLREMNESCPLKVKFEREPKNLYDVNAIRVICDERPWKDMHVGYIARQSAAEIAGRIDHGRIQLTGGYLNNVNDGSGVGEMKVEFTRRRAKN